LYEFYGVLQASDVTFVDSDRVSAALPSDLKHTAEKVGGVAACVDAFNQARALGLTSACILCPNCSAPHLDCGEWVRVHKTHKCLACKKNFASGDRTGHTVGNPLASFLSDADV
jgi:hypothetical protein